jgi:hypothetical protein
MSLETLLSKTMVAFTRGAPVEDEYHNPIPGEIQEAGEWPCSLSPLEGQELTTGRETVISRFLLVIGSNGYGLLPVLGAADRVTIEGISYELEGPPLAFERPGEGPHHLEAKVRAVTG